MKKRSLHKAIVLNGLAVSPRFLGIKKHRQIWSIGRCFLFLLKLFVSENNKNTKSDNVDYYS